MKRIVVIGSSGAGKTSLAKILAKKFGMLHIELDALNWLPNWRARSPEALRQLVSKNIQQPQWVLCGNYSYLREMIWAKADTIIWLDYPFGLCFWQTLTRSLR
ncbi:MAG: AAA family ATPase, partial [Gammaproteobacteria bacterium]|nr:AAA family ATPase [Gammaproteobacteria bacterium]